MEGTDSTGPQGQELDLHLREEAQAPGFSLDEVGEQASHTVLMVSGMHCGACANRVEKTAKKIVGVTVATASQPKGTAEITYDPTKTNPEAIAKVISERTAFKAEAPKTGQKKD